MKEIKAAVLKNLFKSRNTNYCPICGVHSVFLDFGRKPRPNALCENCKSLERHRLIWLFLRKKTDFFSNQRLAILHIAPEHCFMVRFDNFFEQYLSGDLNRFDVKEKIDITQINHDKESFDVILCNHVLEHIIDDRKAIAELYRVLRKGRWAIITVPLYGRTTYEDYSITSPADRLAVFGQEDHVRKYGYDIESRLTEAGFNVQIVSGSSFLSEQEIRKMRIGERSIWLCSKW